MFSESNLNLIFWFNTMIYGWCSMRFFILLKSLIPHTDTMQYTLPGNFFWAKTIKVSTLLAVNQCACSSCKPVKTGSRTQASPCYPVYCCFNATQRSWRSRSKHLTKVSHSQAIKSYITIRKNKKEKSEIRVGFTS